MKHEFWKSLLGSAINSAYKQHFCFFFYLLDATALLDRKLNVT